MVEVPYVWSDQFDMKIQSVGRIGTEETTLFTPSADRTAPPGWNRAGASYLLATVAVSYPATFW